MYKPKLLLVYIFVASDPNKNLILLESMKASLKVENTKIPSVYLFDFHISFLFSFSWYFWKEHTKKLWGPNNLRCV